MYMHVFLIILLILGCESGKLDSRLEQGGDDVLPTGKPQVKIDECKASCAVCAAWNWGEWSPATDSVCTGQSLTQQREGSRTCSDLCAGVECPLTKTEEREQQGTKTCTRDTPPPSCETSCAVGAGCTEWQVTTDWSPSPDSVCVANSPLTQRQKLRRTCTNLCPGTDCLREKPETRDVQGTKTTPCNKHCSPWGKWDKEWTNPNTICKDTTLQEKRTRSRTCTGLCRGTNCLLEETKPRKVKGTKATTCDTGCSWSGWRAVAGQKPASEVCKEKTFKQQQENIRTCDKTKFPCVDKATCETTKTRTQEVEGTKDCGTAARAEEETAEAVAEQKETCESACDPWGAWSETKSCTDTASFTQRGSYTMERNRTCDTTNLKAGEKCPTKNSEKIRCDYCQGAGQKLASNDICECDPKQDYYKASASAESCTKCEAPKVMKQVNGTWTCAEYECDCDGKDGKNNDVCGKWGAWTLQDGAKQLSQVCKGEKFAQTQEQTRTCKNAACLQGKTCETKKTQPVTPMPVGTKETVCDDDCGAWGDWSAWLPAEAPANCTGTFTQKQTRTRDCSQACSSANCDTSDPNPKEQEVACPQDPQKTTLESTVVVPPEDPPPCDCNMEYTWEPATDALRPSDICKGEYFNQAQTGTRDFGNSACNTQCVTSSTREETLEGEKETPCTSCNPWQSWSDWSPALSSGCSDTSASAFALEKTIEQSRSRSRTCSNLCSYSKCPIANSEKIQADCPYCRGEGQLPQDDGSCLCDTDKGYYRVEGQTGCAKCEPPNVLAYDSDDDTWECRANNDDPSPSTCNTQPYYSGVSIHSDGYESNCHARRNPFDCGDYLIMPLDNNRGRCLCDGRRNYKPNGEGSCVCRKLHAEVTTALGKKECTACGATENLRKVGGNWTCVTCGLEQLIDGSDDTWGGSGCYCGKYTGDRNFTGSLPTTRDGVSITATVYPPDAFLARSYTSISDDKHTALLAWRDNLNTWYNETGLSIPEQRIRNAIGSAPPATNVDYGHGLGTEENRGMWRAFLWQWFLTARKHATLSKPPIPEEWKTFYSQTATELGSTSTLSDDSNLKYITCTAVTWLDD